MAEIGNFLVWLGFITAIYGTLVAVLAGATRRMDFTISAERAVAANFAMAVASFILLEVLFLSDRFDVYYVAKASRRDLPLAYKITAVWSSMEGSLLLWSLVLAIYAFLAVRKTRPMRGPLAAYATAVMSGTQVFFLGLIAVHENPFRYISDVQSVAPGFTPADGQGMNPLLVHPAMAIHPPMLYTGFVGFVVPYAFAIGALLSRQLDESWIRTCPGSSWASASSWAGSGPTSCSAGADTGAGIRSKTPPFCPGSRRPPICTR
jgi:cytochrome c-type biogenesis protein CcmF